MRKLLFTASIAMAMAACGQPAATDNEAQAQTGAAQSGEVSSAEQAAILAALRLPAANASGEVLNACEERVVPQFLPADLGPGIGRAVLFAIGGGPNMASCYGDGANLHLLRNVDGGWREIWSMQAGALVILPTMHNNAYDIAQGGPGLSFPVDQWDGTAYVAAQRTVGDDQLNGARFLP
jgi:hypothetical protein